MQQTWETAVNNHIHAAPQSWEPANNINNEQEEDPRTFQEWKKKGQPYPSWFCFDLDPWYDDEGVRRSLEGVYEVLYGENAQENFKRKMVVIPKEVWLPSTANSDCFHLFTQLKDSMQ